MTAIHKELSSFTVKLSIFTVIIYAIALGAMKMLNVPLSIIVITILTLFFAVISLLMHRVLLNASAKRPQQFVNTFMGLTGGRLLLLLIIILITLSLIKEQAQKISVTIFFLGLYLSYTTFEISLLLKALGKTNIKKAG